MLAQQLRLSLADIERIDALEADPTQLFLVMTLKREKLRVKDKIAWIASRLTPDIIA